MNKKVELLKKKDINSYIEFIKEVFDYEPLALSIEKMLKNEKVLIIKEESKIIASAVIETHFEFIKNQEYYHIGYFGVLKEYRREGYATMIFDEIENQAHKNSIKYLELTSGNHRRAAHHFYKSREFKIKDTTIFIKIY